jgi:hypothetical protein
MTTKTSRIYPPHTLKWASTTLPAAIAKKSMIKIVITTLTPTPTNLSRNPTNKTHPISHLTEKAPVLPINRPEKQKTLPITGNKRPQIILLHVLADRKYKQIPSLAKEKNATAEINNFL